MKEDIINKRIIDGIYGFVTGDALGVPVEFSSRELFTSVCSLAKVSLDDVNTRLKSMLDIENSAISIILPDV